MHKHLVEEKRQKHTQPRMSMHQVLCLYPIQAWCLPTLHFADALVNHLYRKRTELTSWMVLTKASKKFIFNNNSTCDQGSNVVARAEVEPMTLRTKGIDSTNAPHTPHKRWGVCGVHANGQTINPTCIRCYPGVDVCVLQSEDSA